MRSNLRHLGSVIVRKAIEQDFQLRIGRIFESCPEFGHVPGPGMLKGRFSFGNGQVSAAFEPRERLIPPTFGRTDFAQRSKDSGEIKLFGTTRSIRPPLSGLRKVFRHGESASTD